LGGQGYVDSNDTDEDEIRAEMRFEKRAAENQRLTLGVSVEEKTYDLRSLSQDFSSNLAPIVSTFSARRQDFSTYVTYQKKLGRWTLLPGIRAEHGMVKLKNGVKSIDNTFFLSPSFHAERELPGGEKLKVSYSRRYNRLGLSTFNTIVRRNTGNSATVGSPNLETSSVDSFEGSIEKIVGTTFWSATAYYREKQNPVGFSVREGPDNMLITSFVNLKDDYSYGVELSGRKRFQNGIRVSGNFNAFENTLSSYSNLVEFSRSAFSYSANITADYTFKTKDTVQAIYSINGDTLSAQGSVEGFYRLDISWQRPLNERTNLTIAAFNVLDSSKEGSVVDDGAMMYQERTQRDDRFIRVGLSYRFGNPSKR
jgi:outer membrane receptor protein involved in Fe transport